MDSKHYKRFMRKVQKDPDTDCWNWTASTAYMGYGTFRYYGKMHGAHRVSYLHFKGEIPDKYDVDHLCRNVKCVNPDHLEAVTHRENMLRGNTFARRQSMATHCSRGHEYTFENTYIIKKRDGSAKGRLCKACRRYYVMRNYYAKKLEKQQT